MAALTLLHLSAACGVVDHGILQMCFAYSYAVTGSALPWIKSYFNDRFEHIAVG